MDNFAKEVLDGTKHINKQIPYVYYNKYGDCVSFICEDEDYFMERCDEDGRITIYVGRKSEKIVGGEIHRVYTLINDLVVKIATKNNKIDMKIVLLASSLRSLRRYNCKEENNLKQLYDVVEKSNLELDFNKFLRG